VTYVTYKFSVYYYNVLNFYDLLRWNMIYLTEKAKEKAREFSGRNMGKYLRLYIKGMG